MANIVSYRKEKKEKRKGFGRTASFPAPEVQDLPELAIVYPHFFYL
jgi:hypothetical protein